MWEDKHELLTFSRLVGICGAPSIEEEINIHNSPLHLHCSADGGRATRQATIALEYRITSARRYEQHYNPSCLQVE